MVEVRERRLSLLHSEYMISKTIGLLRKRNQDWLTRSSIVSSMPPILLINTLKIMVKQRFTVFTRLKTNQISKNTGKNLTGVFLFLILIYY